MEQVDIRDYLYHGIIVSNCEFGALHILDSILRIGYLVDSTESRQYGIKPMYDTYSEMGYSPRISLGFYPLDQKTYELSKRRKPEYYGEKIEDKILAEHQVSKEELDSYIMSKISLNHGKKYSLDYAWKTFYRGITLMLNKRLLDELEIADFGLLVDEICIGEPIDMRKYLEYIAVSGRYYKKEVLYLIKKYLYDIKIIDFDTGEIIKEEDLQLNEKDIASLKLTLDKQTKTF